MAKITGRMCFSPQRTQRAQRTCGARPGKEEVAADGRRFSLIILGSNPRRSANEVSVPTGPRAIRWLDSLTIQSSPNPLRLLSQETRPPGR